MFTFLVSWFSPVIVFIDTIGQSLVRLAVITIPPSVATPFFLVIGIAGHPLTITAVLCIVCLVEILRHRDGVAVFYIAAVSVTWLTVRLLKYLIGRGRPQLVDSFLIFANGSSFPSGHTAMATVIYGYVIWLLYKKSMAEKGRRVNKRWNSARFVLAMLLGALIILIGFSRIYEGVHWLSDVLAGWCTGAAITATVILISRARENSREAI